MSTIRDAHGRDHRPAGSPASTGGQYAPQQAPGIAAQFPIVADTPELVDQQNRARSRAIAAGIGYIPSSVQVPMTDPRHAKAVERWHEQARATAEFNTRGTRPLIPADWGEQLPGKSSRGKRRMGRRSYRSADGKLAIRSYPMTRIRSYAEANGEGNPFDVPVEFEVSDESVLHQAPADGRRRASRVARGAAFRS
ncbi:hypothetical protein AA0Z99_00120 [Agrococcus sp. 1P02AA]|uniref:hypothetical protein n=1 Tax=Agrococcus sp. 1P02AA TaxID=3132259 RepID=UPI0039A6192A